MTVEITAALITAIRQAALDAGAAIMDIYQTDFEVITKKDESPVTIADQAAEDIILPVLRSLTPEVPIVAEESFAAGHIPEVDDAPFWLVDPLDGTKQFISKKDEFTVNIALVVNRTPVLGIVHAPAINQTYIGGPDGAFLEEDGGPARPIHCRNAPEAGIVAVASRSHRTPETDDYLAKFNVADLMSSGSSIKFCLVARGLADLYPRFGPTMEWDTGAGQAVLQAAGGMVTNVDGSPYLYGKDGFKNGYFIARGPGVG